MTCARTRHLAVRLRYTLLFTEQVALVASVNLNRDRNHLHLKVLSTLHVQRPYICIVSTMPMEYRRLGSSGLKVIQKKANRLCAGFMQILAGGL